MKDKKVLALNESVVSNTDFSIEIRFMDAAEATGLSRCILSSYGQSYESKWVYHPELIAEKINGGLYRSVIGLADGEIVGHIGLSLDAQDDKIGEVGQAVVDTRFRGQHLFTSLKSYLAQWCTDQGLFGLFSEVTAAHPYSQKANIDLNATETGILLGYIPAAVKYKGIKENSAPHRNSIVLFYLKTNPGHVRPVYAPVKHKEIVGEIFSHSGLRGKLTDIDPRETPLQDKSELHVLVREDHNQALITVDAYGIDIGKRLDSLLKAHCAQGLHCIYLDLPLNDPETGRLEDELERLGFYFGGIFPNRRINGDVLRLQYLNDVEIHSADIHTASTFGAELLEYILSSASLLRRTSLIR